MGKEVDMLKITAFKLGTIQDCMHILNECEAEGITDIRYVRKMLSEYILELGKEARLVTISEKKRISAMRDPCPECGKPLTRTEADGLVVLACRYCRWSGIEGKI